MNADHAKFLRVFTIIRLLAAKDKGISLPEIAKAINVSERTVRRYIKLLRDLGFKVETNRLGETTLYRLLKNQAEVSNLFDYLPELNYPAQMPVKTPPAQKQDAPVWILKGKATDDYHVYDTLFPILEQHPVESADMVYRKLKESKIAIYPNFRIIKAPFFKRRRGNKI